MALRTLESRDGAVTLKGYLADDVRPGARPGVVLFPEAFGIGDHVIGRGGGWRRWVMLPWPQIRTETACRRKVCPVRSS
jgi:hypothetical protein